MAGSSSDVCEEIYAGEKPASEPEVQAIQDFILSKKGEWLSFVTVHSYGGYWLHHWERNNPDFNRKQYIHLVNIHWLLARIYSSQLNCTNFFVAVVNSVVKQRPLSLK